MVQWLKKVPDTVTNEVLARLAALMSKNDQETMREMVIWFRDGYRGFIDENDLSGTRLQAIDLSIARARGHLREAKLYKVDRESAAAMIAHYERKIRLLRSIRVKVRELPR